MYYTTYDPDPGGAVVLGMTEAFLKRDAFRFHAINAPSPGVYALYYTGPHPYYGEILSPDARQPIYVGKADGNLGKRLDQHIRSLNEVPSLERRDFLCRFLALKDGWPLLLEHKLIQRFRPLWNQEGFEGFGNNGSERVGGKATAWDNWHPGRKSAEGLVRWSAKSVTDLEGVWAVRRAIGIGTVQDLFSCET